MTMLQLPLLLAPLALGTEAGTVLSAAGTVSSHAGSGPPAAATAPAGRFDAPRALAAPVDPSRLAVLMPGAAGDGELARAAAESVGFAVGTATRMTSGGWFVITLEAGEIADPSRLAELSSGAAVALASPVLRGAHGQWGAPTDELLVRLAPSDRIDPTSGVPAGTELLESDFAGIDGLLRLRLPSVDGSLVLEAARELSAGGRYEFVEPRLVFTGGGSSQPNDPLFDQQWAWNNTGQNYDGFDGEAGFDMNLEEARSISSGDPAIGILVIDVGVDPGHEDLNWTTGIDLMGATAGVPGGPQNVCDEHGTQVAGVSSAQTDNGLGIAGIAPDCTLLSARNFESIAPFCTGGWTTITGNTALALDFGANNGARVTINSNFYGFTSPTLEAAYAAQAASGVVHFGSAGNFSTAGVTYPASLPDVIAVGGTDNFATTFGTTAIGEEVEFTGPGFNVITTDLTGAFGQPGDYTNVGGTSYAAPHLGGLAAAMLAVNPSLDQDAVRQIFRAAAFDLVSNEVDSFVGRDLVAGYGQPDAVVALEIANGTRVGLASDGAAIDTWAGGSSTLEVISYPPLSAGTLYLTLGSATGTGPGLPFLGDVLPLTPDAYFNFTLASPNSPPLVGGFGVLGAGGDATASFSIPSGALSPAELLVHHSVLALDVVPALALARGIGAPRSTWVSNTSTFDGTAPSPVAIPDATVPGLVNPLTVSGIGSSIEAVNLTTFIGHEFGGHLELILESPQGTRVTLFSPDAGLNLDGLNGVWGDYFGTVDSMDAFDGEDPNGVWTLEVSDHFVGNVGELEGWSISITSS